MTQPIHHRALSFLRALPSTLPHTQACTAYVYARVYLTTASLPPTVLVCIWPIAKGKYFSKDAITFSVVLESLCTYVFHVLFYQLSLYLPWCFSPPFMLEALIFSSNNDLWYRLSNMLWRVIWWIFWRANNPMILRVIYCMNQSCCQEETPTSALNLLRLLPFFHSVITSGGCYNVPLPFFSSSHDRRSVNKEGRRRKARSGTVTRTTQWSRALSVTQQEMMERE